MKYSAPKQSTWLIALAAGALGALLQYRVLHVAVLVPYAFLLVAGALALLLVATVTRSL